MWNWLANWLEIEIDDFMIIIAHAGIIVFHFIEFMHVNALSIALAISVFWAVESIFEVRKGVRKWRKNRKTHKPQTYSIK